MLKNLQGYTNFGLKIGNTTVWPNCLFVVATRLRARSCSLDPENER